VHIEKPFLTHAEHALLKSYNMTRDTGVLKLLALLLPRDGNLPAQEDSM